jgi:hypothetical protein
MSLFNGSGAAAKYGINHALFATCPHSRSRPQWHSCSPLQSSYSTLLRPRASVLPSARMSPSRCGTHLLVDSPGARCGAAFSCRRIGCRVACGQSARPSICARAPARCEPAVLHRIDGMISIAGREDRGARHALRKDTTRTERKGNEDALHHFTHPVLPCYRRLLC